MATTAAGPRAEQARAIWLVPLLAVAVEPGQPLELEKLSDVVKLAAARHAFALSRSPVEIE